MVRSFVVDSDMMLFVDDVDGDDINFCFIEKQKSENGNETR